MVAQGQTANPYAQGNSNDYMTKLTAEREAEHIKECSCPECLAHNTINSAKATSKPVLNKTLPKECQYGDLRHRSRCALFDSREGDPAAEAITNDVHSKYNSCYQALYNKCYSRLKPIDKKSLSEVFKDAIKNPIYRMPAPSAKCSFQAYLLSKELNDRGYETKIIELNHFQALIAVVKDF
jgi:hypothetical protein